MPGYTASVAQFGAPRVEAEDAATFSEFCDRKRLLSLYSMGVREDSAEFRSSAEGSEQWYRISVQMARYPGSDEIKLFETILNIDAERRRQENLVVRASRDALTGLLNRAAMESRVRASLAAAKPDALSVLYMLDLDSFKQINDTLGHQAGDEVLRTTAEAFSGVFRREDAARLGGDEFMIFLPSCPSPAEAESRAAALVGAAQSSVNGVTVTASVGAACCLGGSMTFEQLYAAADKALYQAKRQGKCRCCMAEYDGEAPAPAASGPRPLSIQYQTLLEYMDGGIFTADVNAAAGTIRITYTSPSFYQSLGRTPEETGPGGEKLLDLVLPADRSAVRRAMFDAADGRVSDCVYRTGEGGRLWRHLRLVRLNAVAGAAAAAGVIGVVLDVTELKNSENSLLLAEERYRVASELTRAKIWELDIPAGTLRLSSALAALWNGTETLSGFPGSLLSSGLFHPDSARDAEKMCADLLAGRGGESYVLRVCLPGGERWVRVSYRVMRGAGSRPARAVGIAEPLHGLDGELRRFQGELLFLRAAAQSVTGVVMADLTAGTVEEFSVPGDERPADLASLSALTAAAVHPDDRARLRAEISPDTLLAAFRAGQTWHFLEYRRQLRGETRWMNLAVNLLRQPVTGHVCAFYYLRDVEQRHRWESMLSDGAERDASSLLYTPTAFAALTKLAIRWMEPRESAALTVIELVGFGAMRDRQGLQSAQQYLFSMGRLFRVLVSGRMFVGHLEDARFAVFRLGAMTAAQQRSAVEHLRGRLYMLLGQVQPGSGMELRCGFSMAGAENANYDRLLGQALLACDTAGRLPGNPVAICDEGEAVPEDSADRERAWELRLAQLTNRLRLAEQDELTGLPGRQAFLRLVRERLDADPNGKYRLLLWDMDGFKTLNDTLGTAAGDRILRDAGAAILARLPAGHLCARLEFDRFAYFVPASYASPEEIFRTVEEWFAAYPLDYRLTGRMGVCEIDDPAEDVRVLCSRALLALRSVKHTETRIAWYDEALRSRAEEEQALSREMAGALERGEFRVYFQPQYNYDSGELIGAEALVRWVHPTRGMIPPGRFIPLFERNGFISRLDEFVWEESCRCLRRWKQEKGKLPTVSLSVNVSRVDIRDPQLADKLLGLTRRYGLPAGTLRLEITESAYMQEPARMIEMVSRLQEMGFLVAMDDFGSGYSSLNTLREMPVDLLKLDMKFLSFGADDTRGGSILSSVVRMAHWLRLPVLAEGVETREQAEYLKSLNCFYMQGYFFGRPMPADEFEALLGRCSLGGTDRLRGEDLSGLETFWAPSAQDVLLFNRFVGGACILDCAAGRAEIIRANDAFFRALGTTREAFCGRLTDLRGVFAGEEREKFTAALAEAVRTGGEASCDALMTPEGGAPVLLRCRARLLARGADTRPVFVSVENLSSVLPKNSAQNAEAVL